jgi:hypothetical protein
LINERIRQQATILIFMLIFILHMGANGRMLQRGISSFRASIKVNVSEFSGMEKICKTYFRCKDLRCTLQGSNVERTVLGSFYVFSGVYFEQET